MNKQSDDRAMGVTYKALDVNLRFAVTLKVINAQLIGDESARQRFVREARGRRRAWATRASPRCFTSERAQFG
jgi:serine/threonine protein kinase